MKKEPRNYAFIDGQNLNLGVQALGWQLDWRRFRVYLQDKYGVARAYYFIGYIPGNENLYRRLQTAGYTLEFKPVLIPQSGGPKGNIDADLVLRAMIDYDAYEKPSSSRAMATSTRSSNTSTARGSSRRC
jgi:hypothetical protein